MAPLFAWLRRIFIPVLRCARHTWQRNEYGVLVCAVCGIAPGAPESGGYW